MALQRFNTEYVIHDIDNILRLGREYDGCPPLVTSPCRNNKYRAEDAVAPVPTSGSRDDGKAKGGEISYNRSPLRDIVATQSRL